MSATHVREWELRRLRAGELAGTEAERVQSHARDCEVCRSRLRRLEEEQLKFEREVFFERFSTGIRYALKGQAQQRRSTWLFPALGLAAAAVVAILVPSLQGFHLARTNRPKGGGPEIVLRVAAPNNGTQRNASSTAPEPLAPGERVRIGYQAGHYSYLAAISMDEEGRVSPLYPEAGRSLRTEDDGQTHFLPESLAFTGKGAERVVVILSEQPVAVDDIRRAAEDAFKRGKGDVQHLPPLVVPGEQFHRILLKP